MEHKKEPTATSRPVKMGHLIRYSHINSIAGVMTTWRKSEHGNIMDQSLKRNNIFNEGQQLFPATIRQIMRPKYSVVKIQISEISKEQAITGVFNYSFIYEYTWVLYILTKKRSNAKYALTSTYCRKIGNLLTHFH